MDDLQTIAFQDVIPVRSISLEDAGSPPTYRVLGADFRSVEDVFVNGVQAEEFMVVTRYQMLVTVPISSVDEVRSVLVLSRSVTLTEASQIRFILNAKETHTGIGRLVKLFTKLMLTTPGRDIFDPELGGGVQSMLGRYLSSVDQQGISAEFSRAVDRVRDQIQSEQADQYGLLPEERLTDTEVISVAFNPGDTALMARVQLLTLAGRAAVVNLVA